MLTNRGQPKGIANEPEHHQAGEVPPYRKWPTASSSSSHGTMESWSDRGESDSEKQQEMLITVNKNLWVIGKK